MTQQRTTYDVCIVGSGAGGGMAAYVLTKAGANVVMLEAGGSWYASRDSAMMMPAYQSPRRGAATRKREFGEFDACDGGFALEGEPYTRAAGQDFQWWRARMLGGRTNHWGRISLRYGPDDFRTKSVLGVGDDWPVSYEDMQPYYDRVDRFVGIFGSNEGIRSAPDGVFQPPPKPRCYELLVKKTCDQISIPCIPSRLSVLTQPINGRAACHYCGGCNRGCSTKSNFSSPDVLIAPAIATGRLTLITNAMAREVTVGPDGLANGINYIDKRTGTDRAVRARIVVLAASACESARILLNSKSTHFPQGLANASGTVGRYLTDTVAVTTMSAHIPAMLDHVPHNEDGAADCHVYMPWWLDNTKLDFPIGYHIEVSGGLRPPENGVLAGIQRYPMGGGYGVALKREYRRYYGSTINLAARGGMVPNANCYCELDPQTVDRYGIPVLRFHWQNAEIDYYQAKHQQETLRSIFAAMGGEVSTPMPTRAQGYNVRPGGHVKHEIGCTRMGNDAASSVVNANCQAHDCRNLFIADGGPFVSQPDKNPTWTILALAWRTSDYIVQERKAGRLL